MNGISPLDVPGLLKALSNADVSFVVIGGFAVGAHGYPRATKDLDIVPDPDPENLKRLATVLEELDAAVLDVEDLQIVGPDLEFSDLESAAVEDEVFGHRVRFCGYEHLVAMKEAAGRPEDLIDLERLREARENA